MADQANDVNQPAVPQEPATPAPSTDENNAPEVADDPIAKALSDDDDTSTKPKAKEPAKAETDKQEKEPAKEPNPDEETDAKEQPRGKDGKFRKEQLNTEIRDLVSQRNELKREVEQMNSQVYRPQSEDELQQQGYSPEMAAIVQMQQERDIERYNNQVAEAQLTIDSESSRVLRDFPIFNPDSSDYKPELASQAAQLLQANLVYDQNTGQVIGSNLSPYQLYQTLAGTYQASQTDGQIKGQRATEQMLANSDVSSNAAPPRTKVDPIMAVLESDD